MTPGLPEAVLLRALRPRLVDGEFVFVTVDGPSPPADLEVHASVREVEGLSIAIARADADRRHLGYDHVAAWITLEVHSPLAAVGLTAAVSRALAEVGISANVIAGHHHDHLLVPADRAADAMAALEALSRG
ncbi:MAG: ACT domain-containing protein [Actinomycetota bacterium]|nr:ACT domain-containing protein [Actinomycetota bacterium]